MKTAFGLALLCCLLSPQASAGETQAIPLDAAALSALPREQATGMVHEEHLACEGVSLLDLLRASGAMPEQPLRGADLARTLQVQARDGYRAAFTLAELDPTLGALKVLVVDRCNGQALTDETGPLRLMVPEDSRPARWVRQLQSITVDAAAKEAGP